MKSEVWFKGVGEINAALKQGLITLEQAKKLILALENANRESSSVRPR